MSYRIAYQSIEKLRGAEKRRRSVGTLLGMGVVLGMLALSLGWPWCFARLRQWCLPGDPDTTVAALSRLQEDLRQGQPLTEALTAFCQQVMDDPA